MIGQKKLLARIDRWTTDTAPRFIILIGSKGSGKKLITKYITTKLQALQVVSDIKVDDVRDVITMSYKQSNETFYSFYDVDRMSAAAKNALLKVTEEPPKKSRFILTAENKSNILNTLLSRGIVIQVEPYTPRDILEYADSRKYDLSDKEEQLVTTICTTPGEVDMIMKYNVEDFYNYVNTVLDNIGIVNGSNAFKIGSKLSYKADEPGWDVSLFLKAVKEACREKLVETKDLRWSKSIQVTSRYESDMKVVGLNKSSTFDMWILRMRGIWV